MTDTPDIKGGGILGEKVQGPRRQLDVFPLPENIKSVEYRSDEVTSTCPITRQPDFYTVTIFIHDTQVGIESKSLKLYLQSFRDDGQFCEMFANTIAIDVRQATQGGGVEVLVEQKPRGGVAIVARAELP